MKEEETSNKKAEWMMVAVRPANRRVVVIGSGAVGQRRAEQFARFGATVEVYDPHMEDEARSQLPQDTVAFTRAASKSDLAGAWLIVVATNDPRVNAEVGSWADELNIDCNRTDDAEAGTMAVPALLHDPVGWKMAMLGGDAGPLFSAWIKARVAGTMSDPQVGIVYRALAAARAEAENLSITSKERGFLMRRAMAQILERSDAATINGSPEEINGAELVRTIISKRSNS